MVGFDLLARLEREDSNRMDMLRERAEAASTITSLSKKVESITAEGVEWRDKFMEAKARAEAAEAERDSLALWKREASDTIMNLTRRSEAAWAESAHLTAERDAALERVKVLEKILRKTVWWAESRCPCKEETPNPCPLCGASVENLEPCKSAESIMPYDLLKELRSCSALSHKGVE